MYSITVFIVLYVYKKIIIKKTVIVSGEVTFFGDFFCIKNHYAP